MESRPSKPVGQAYKDDADEESDHREKKARNSARIECACHVIAFHLVGTGGIRSTFYSIPDISECSNDTQSQTLSGLVPSGVKAFEFSVSLTESRCLHGRAESHLGLPYERRHSDIKQES